MKRLVMILLLIMLVTTTSFSQNTLGRIKQDSTVCITAAQLKETNLIFAEHSKLLQENSLLLKQLSNYKYDNLLLSQADSVKSLQIDNYKSLNSSYLDKINSLNEEITKKNKVLNGWRIGGVTVTVGLVLWLLLK